MTDKEKYLQEIQNVPVNEDELRKQRIPVTHPVQDAPTPKTLDHGLVNEEIGNYDHEKVTEALLHQEEPVSERFAFRAIPRLLEMIEPSDRAKAYIAKLADTLEVEGYSTDAKIVREILKRMNGEKVPMATMDEEPASDDLKKELAKLLKECGVDAEYIHRDFLWVIARHFAEWQKEQFEKNRLAACDKQTEEEAQIEFDFVMDIVENEHRQPTFDDAIKYGMRLQKEQIMKGKVNMYSDLMGGVCIKNKWLIEAMKAANIEKGSRVYIVVVPKED